MVEQSCGSCVFFRPMTEEAGECRRQPPQVVVLQQSGTQPQLDPRTGVIREQPVVIQKPQGVFPALRIEDPGCGEYQPTEAAVQKAVQEAQAMEPAPTKARTMHDA